MYIEINNRTPFIINLNKTLRCKISQTYIELVFWKLKKILMNEIMKYK
jgi:hypothetical protein